MHSSKSRLIFLFLPVPFIFYWYTCLPSIGMSDSVRFIGDIKDFTISTGVNHHNFTTLWGWLVQCLPFGDLAYRGNLSCALAGGLAIGIFYISLYSVHRCWITALISSLFLMVSQSMWWHSTFLYEYAMNAVFVTIAIYLYGQLYKTGLIKYLYALFFLSGLALFQHYLLGALLVGSVTAFLWRIPSHKERPWPALGISALFFLLGLVPWLLTFIHDLSISHNIAQTVSQSTGSSFEGLYFSKTLWQGLSEYFFLLFLQFPSLYLLPVILGLYFFLRSWKLTASSMGLLFTFLTIVCYELGHDTWIWFIFSQSLPSYILLVFWSSFVIHKIIHHPNILKSLLLRWLVAITILLSLGWTIYFYSQLSRWGGNPNSIWYSQFNNTATFNCYRTNEFIANPNKKNYHDIEDFCNLILEKLPPHAEYWDSYTTLYLELKLYYQRFYHRRLDLEMICTDWAFQDIKSYAPRLKQAYLNGKDIFFGSLGGPSYSFLSGLPDKQNYQFKKYYLNNKRWVYKLITFNEKNNLDNSLWRRWDILPANKPVLINLTLENVLDFHEGNVIYQQNMAQYGPFWKNDDQIFFTPYKQGAEIGFLLRFTKTFKGDMDISFTTAPDAGIVEVLLNNVPLIPDPIDLYTFNIYNKTFKFKNVSFSNGYNILSIQILGKNDRSRDMLLGVDTIRIAPGADQR